MNDARNEEIARLRKQDRLTYIEIGQKFGISRERVRQICVKFQADSPSRFDPLTEDLRESIRRMVFAKVRSDHIIESIVSRYHVAINSVKKAICEFNTERLEQTREQAKRLYRKLKSTYLVADKLGVSHTQAWHLLKETGILAPRHSGYPKKIRDHAMALMREHPIIWVSRKLKISPKTLSAWWHGGWGHKKKSRVGEDEWIARQTAQNGVHKSRRRARAVSVLDRERRKLDARRRPRPARKRAREPLDLRRGRG